MPTPYHSPEAAPYATIAQVSDAAREANPSSWLAQDHPREYTDSGLPKRGSFDRFDKTAITGDEAVSQLLDSIETDAEQLTIQAILELRRQRRTSSAAHPPQAGPLMRPRRRGEPVMPTTTERAASDDIWTAKTAEYARVDAQTRPSTRQDPTRPRGAHRRQRGGLTGKHRA